MICARTWWKQIKRCSKAIKWICHYMKTKYAYTLSLIDVLTYHNHIISLSLFLNSAHKIRLVTIASFETAHMSGYLCECRSGQRHLRHCTVGGCAHCACKYRSIIDGWVRLVSAPIQMCGFHWFVTIGDTARDGPYAYSLTNGKYLISYKSIDMFI